MRAKLIRISDLRERDIGAWRDLAERAIEPNPYHEPAFLLPLTAAQRKQDTIALVVVESNGTWLAALPIEHGHWHRIPLRSVATSLSPYSFLGTPLMDASKLEPTMSHLVEAMLREYRSSFAALEWISDDDGPIARATQVVLSSLGARAMIFEQFSRAAIRRGEASVDQALSSRSLREIRRKGRKLEEALGDEVTTTDRSSDDMAYKTFLELEGSGWKGDRKTAMQDIPGDADFFISMCRAFAEMGRLRLLLFGTPTQAVAAQCDLIAGDELFSFKIAYDAEWSRFSPGMQLHLDGARLFYAREDLRLYDSCSDPRNDAANRKFPQRRGLASYVVRDSGIGGAASRPIIGIARSVRNRKASR